VVVQQEDADPRGALGHGVVLARSAALRLESGIADRSRAAAR
jgi:hypothetical protein